MLTGRLTKFYRPRRRARNAAYPDYVYEAQEQLSKADFVADVLKRTSLLEEDLDFTLSLYFCGPGRHFTYIDIVSSHMQFNAKIKIFESIPVRKNLKSRVQALSGLRRFQRIRNTVAHPILVRPSKVQALCDDQIIRAILLQFHKPIEAEFRCVRRSLDHITRSREWRPDLTAKKPDKVDQIHNFMHRITYD
jgi:hypothetical protein